MKKNIFFLFLLVAMPAWGKEPVEKQVGLVVDFVESAWITHGKGKAEAVQFKTPIYKGDLIETSKSGAVKILFKDDTLLTVKENSKALITEYLFNAKAKKRSAIFSVPFGRVRTIVGKFFGKDQPVTVETPMAVAGIRGTDVGAEVRQRETQFYCFDGSVETFNKRFADRRVLLEEGRAILVQEGRATELGDVTPIPREIDRNREEIFDITLNKKSHSRETAEEQGSAAANKEKKRLRQTPESQTVTGTSPTDQEPLPGGSTEVTGSETDVTVTFPD